MKKCQKKKTKSIFKVMNMVKITSLFISFLGLMGLIVVVFLAPDIVENGNYYAGLFACTTAILLFPAVSYVEEELNPANKDKKEGAKNQW